MSRISPMLNVIRLLYTNKATSDDAKKNILDPN